MLFEDTYQTIGQPAEGQFSDKGSRFLAYAYPIKNDTEIKDMIAVLKAKHPKAVHYCWAVRLTPDRSVFRVNDDGEPSGTAGRPILNVLLSKNITNTLVVVVRYFGGTLLGVPGLINAYKTATANALDAVNVVEQTVKDVYTVRFSYPEMNSVMKVIKDGHLSILHQQFDNDCEITMPIRKTEVNQILSRLDSIAGVTAQYNYTA